MDVLINSDILFDGRLIIDSLSQALSRLLEVCRDHGHRVVLPETAKLEWDRQQSEQVIQARSALASAYKTLEVHQISHENRQPEEVISPPDLVALMKSSGAAVVVEGPTLDDFLDAHRRACLHQPPRAPDTKSDEMRDLVIWAIALRVARTQGKAMLLSRDSVHTHERGEEEAASVGLLRAATVEDALELLKVETPAGQLFSEFVSPAWNDLRAAGLPIGTNPRLSEVTRASLLQGPDGSPLAADADIEIASDGSRSIRGHMEVRALPGERQRVLLTSLRIEEHDLPPRVAECTSALRAVQVDDFTERLAALKGLVKGTQ